MNNFNDASLQILRLQKAVLKSDMEQLLIFLLPGHNRRLGERRSGIERRSAERAALAGRRGSDEKNVVSPSVEAIATASDRRLPPPVRLRGLRKAFDNAVQQEEQLKNWQSRQH